MNNQQTSKTVHIWLWVVQVFLAAILISGTVMKFQSIETISAVMPWTGQVPSWVVRCLGVVDLAGGLGLVLPAALRIRPMLTPWVAVGVILLMLSAIVFHLSRGEASVIGLNIFSAAAAMFIAWGRFVKAPVSPK